MLKCLRLMLLATCLLSLSSVAADRSETWIAAGDGRLTVGTDGRIAELVVNQRFGSDIDDALTQQMLAWQFEPLAGHELTEPVSMIMHFELRAFRSERDGPLAVGITEMSLFEQDAHATALRTMTKPPVYPTTALRRGLGASMNFRVEVAADGSVLRAAPESGAWLLEGTDTGRHETKLRPFIRASVVAVKQWRFAPSDDDQPRQFSVPIRYVFGQQGAGAPVWQRAFRVAVPPEPWMIEQSNVAKLGRDGTEAAKLRLLTPLDSLENPAG